MQRLEAVNGEGIAGEKLAKAGNEADSLKRHILRIVGLDCDGLRPFIGLGAAIEGENARGRVYGVFSHREGPSFRWSGRGEGIVAVFALPAEG